MVAIRMKDGPIAARYRRVIRHWRHKKAVVAVAHEMLVILYYLRKDHVSYQELGATYLEQRDCRHATRRQVKPLTRLGHRAKLEPVALETAAAF
jgi:hypothetical protein